MNKQQYMQNIAAVAILLTAFCLFPVSASTLQSHTDISHAVKQYVLHQQVPLNNVEVTLTSLNKQLRLSKCASDLKVNKAPGSKLIGNISLSVSCAAPYTWKIHVAAHVDGQVDTLIARHPLIRGTVIQDTDIEYVSRQYSELNHGYYSSANLLIGKEAKRNIKAGKVLTPALVKAQKLVLRGQHITIVAQKGGLKLRVKGKALMDGQQGQTIRVTNLKSKKLIYARVVSSGVVRVNF